jgi:hypothetical protein
LREDVDKAKKSIQVAIDDIKALSFKEISLTN